MIKNNRKQAKPRYRRPVVFLLVLAMMTLLLTPVFAEDENLGITGNLLRLVEEQMPEESPEQPEATPAVTDKSAEDPITAAIGEYVTGLGGVHPTPYVKGGMAMAWGCCAFVNLVWLHVFGKDTYDAQPASVESGGAVSDMASWLTANGAQNGDIIWAHNGFMTHYIIIHDWDENGMWISDGCMAGIVAHNHEYVSYDYYPGFFNGACALTLYRLPEDMKTSVEPEIPEDFEEDTWSSEPILTAMSEGIMETNDEGNFCPNRYVSRAMIVEILYSLEGRPSVSGRAFKDVPSDAWFADSVLWAASNNIISGDDVNMFSPDKALSRQDLAGVLYNYAKYKGVLEGNAVELTRYSDVDSVPYYDVYPLQWAVGNELLGGDGTELLPSSFTTRAQVAQIMTQFKSKAGL